MDHTTRTILSRIAREHPTPAYAYFVEEVRARFDAVTAAFGGRFGVSYAVKANPCVPLIHRFLDKVSTLDVSSIGEAERGMHAGCPPERMTFSGPAKRRFELERAVEIGIGEMVCESVRELDLLNQIATEAGRTMTCLLRLTPSRAPKNFGVQFAGRASQFGIDEEQVDAVLGRFSDWPSLRLKGFHVYSGTNSLNEEAIAENFSIFIEMFTRFSETHGLHPSKLVFGAGFGIPYHENDRHLDLGKLAALVNPMVDAMRKNPRLAEAELTLEMGRYLVGLAGYLLTSVISEKTSRGTEIRLCDAGFNNNLAACGMMGTVIRRNWAFWNVSAPPNAPEGEYLLVGPLCTTIDVLAQQITLPRVGVGDVLAVGCCGAYGVTASPTRFISHPEPREILVVGSGPDAELIDATEVPLRHTERRFPIDTKAPTHA